MAHTAITGETGNRWYALHVRARHEKAVAGVLQNKDFVEFLPVYRSRRQWSQRVAEIDLPLFPGYVFCRFDPAERRVPIMTTPGVMGIVGFGGRPVPVDDGEIEAIQRVLKSGVPSEPWKHIQSGQKVRVAHGVLSGLEGTFIEAKKNHRLLLNVTILQRSVAIEMDIACVVPVNPGRAPLLAAVLAAQ